MKFFITGTDTDVGKTIISAWLTQHLQADYWKPIQSGITEGWDRHTVQKLTGLPDSHFHREAYALKAPLSPHLAAQMEGIEIDLGKIQLPQTTRPLIIEGAGGIMVPLNEKETMLDLMKKLDIPVIVIARSSLGTINHTCLTLAILRQWSIPVKGVILNGPLNPENKKAIEYYGNVKVIGELDWIDSFVDKGFPKILHNMFD